MGRLLGRLVSSKVLEVLSTNSAGGARVLARPFLKAFESSLRPWSTKSSNFGYGVNDSSHSMAPIVLPAHPLVKHKDSMQTQDRSSLGMSGGEGLSWVSIASFFTPLTSQYQ